MQKNTYKLSKETIERIGNKDINSLTPEEEKLVLNDIANQVEHNLNKIYDRFYKEQEELKTISKQYTKEDLENMTKQEIDHLFYLNNTKNLYIKKYIFDKTKEEAIKHLEEYKLLSLPELLNGNIKDINRYFNPGIVQKELRALDPVQYHEGTIKTGTTESIIEIDNPEKTTILTNFDVKVQEAIASIIARKTHAKQADLVGKTFLYRIPLSTIAKHIFNTDRAKEKMIKDVKESINRQTGKRLKINFEKECKKRHYKVDSGDYDYQSNFIAGSIKPEIVQNQTDTKTGKQITLLQDVLYITEIPIIHRVAHDLKEIKTIPNEYLQLEDLSGKRLNSSFELTAIAEYLGYRIEQSKHKADKRKVNKTKNQKYKKLPFEDTILFNTIYKEALDIDDIKKISAKKKYIIDTKIDKCFISFKAHKLIKSFKYENEKNKKTKYSIKFKF